MIVYSDKNECQDRSTIFMITLASLVLRCWRTHRVVTCRNGANVSSARLVHAWLIGALCGNHHLPRLPVRGDDALNHRRGWRSHSNAVQRSLRATHIRRRVRREHRRNGIVRPPAVLARRNRDGKWRLLRGVAKCVRGHGCRQSMAPIRRRASPVSWRS